MEIYLDNHFKLSPTSLADLVRWLCYNSVGAFVAFVELEVDLLHKRLHIFVIVGLDVNRPLVSVPILLALLPKGSRYVAVNDRLHLGYSLKSIEILIMLNINKLKKYFQTFTRPPESGPKSANFNKAIAHNTTLQ